MVAAADVFTLYCAAVLLDNPVFVLTIVVGMRLLLRDNA